MVPPRRPESITSLSGDVARRGTPGNGGVTRSPLPGRWAPGLADLLGYRRAWLRGDILAGLTVAAYLVPQVLAYATIAGLPRARCPGWSSTATTRRCSSPTRATSTAAERIFPTLPTAVAAYQQWRDGDAAPAAPS
jgi:hypothetical protein